MARRLSALLMLLFCKTGLLWAYPTPVDVDGKLSHWPLTSEAPTLYYKIEAETESDYFLFEATIEAAAALWSEIPGSLLKLERRQVGAEDISIQLTQDVSDAYSSGYSIFDDFDSKERPKHCTSKVLVLSSLSYDSIHKTILHELGHCLGLGHSLIPQAIMSYSLDENAFELDTDDMAAIARLYPEDGSKPKLPPGCAVGAVAPTSTVLVLLLLLLPLLFVLLRRRRSKPH